MIASRVDCRSGVSPCRPASLAELIAHVAQHVVPGGVPALAIRVWARTGDPRSRDTFGRWFLKVCSPHETAYRLPVDLVGPFCCAAGDDALIAELARDAGGVFVRVPTSAVAPADILDSHLRVIREIGDQAAALATMLEDGRIETREVADFERQSDEAIAALVALKAIVRAHAESAPEAVAV